MKIGGIIDVSTVDIPNKSTMVIDGKDKFQKPEHATILTILERYQTNDLPFKIYLRDDKVGYCLINDIWK